MDRTTTDLGQLRLFQLGSACLPVGAYAFSQGMEAAVELRWLSGADDIETWLGMQLQYSLAYVDLPLMVRMDTALRANDLRALSFWNASLLACRESNELRLGDTASGEALARLLPGLGITALPALQPPAFLTLFTVASVHWQLPVRLAALAYAWSWLENQVIAATKLLPIGQTRAQQLLSHVQQHIPQAVSDALALSDEQIGSSLPGLALASIHHETQYSRLFRS